MTNDTTQTPVILSREGKIGRNAWRQYFIVRDRSIVLLDMTPAPWGGWNVSAVSRQGEESWPDMTRDEIVRFRLTADNNPKDVVLSSRVETLVVTDEITIRDIFRLERKYEGVTGRVNREG